MPKEITWKKAIDKVLAASGVPLHYKEITEAIISNGLRTSLGATPAATVNAQISASIKKHGHESPYVRVAKGTFALSEKASPKAPPKSGAPGSTTTDLKDEEDPDLSK